MAYKHERSTVPFVHETLTAEEFNKATAKYMEEMVRQDKDYLIEYLATLLPTNESTDNESH